MSVALPLPLPRRSTRWRPISTAWLHAWYVPAGIGLLWLLACQFDWMSEQVLPSPTQVWSTFVEFAHGELWSELAISLQRLALGLLGGISIGLALGVALGSSARAERWFLPTFSALAQIPTLAWIPLFMLLFGLGEALKLVVMIKAVIVPVTLHTLVGVRDASPNLREVTTTLQWSPWQRFRGLTLPSALPSIMAGLRLAVATGWASLLAVELLASSEGIGYLMVWGRQLFMLDLVFVCIALIGVLGVVLDRAVNRAEQFAVYWPHLATSAFSRREQSTAQRLQGWVLPLTLLVIWQLSSHFNWIDSAIVATPSSVWQALIQGLTDGSLWGALSASVSRAVIGLVIGGSLGVLAGVWLGTHTKAERIAGPSLGAVRQVAVFAWVPLITAWFGLGEGAKWVFVSLVTFFPLFIATQRGIAALSPALAESAQMLRLNPWQRLRYWLLPGISPALFAGLRVALIYAWLGTIGAEYFMPSQQGIGNLLMGAQQLFRMDQVMACMLLIGLTGALFNTLGHTLERHATRWRTA